MSRTARHVRPSEPREDDPAWRRVVVYDLRHSSRVLADAAREGRRARPERVRRSVAVYSFLRSQGDRSIGTAALIEERRARARLRTATVALLRAVNVPAGPVRAAGADTVDVPLVRHRHSALW